MATFKPIKKAKAGVLTTPIQEGQFLCATDTGEMWLDVSNSERIQCGGNPSNSGTGNGGLTHFIDVPYLAVAPPAVAAANIDLTTDGYIFKLTVHADVDVNTLSTPMADEAVQTFEIHIAMEDAYTVNFDFNPQWVGGDPPDLEVGVTSVLVFRIIKGNCVGNLAYTY